MSQQQAPRRRTRAASTAPLAVTAALTTWLAMLSWRGFSVEPGRYLAPLVVLAVVVVGTGLVGRNLRLPGAAVFAGQTALGTLVASALITHTLLPVGGGWSALADAFARAVDSANTYAAPVPGNVPGVHPLLIAGGLGCLLLVDLLACTVRRVPLTGLPLLSVYSVPVSMLGTGLSWWVFAVTAVGYLVMLFLHESEQIGRWGRRLMGGSTEPSADHSAARTAEPSGRTALTVTGSGPVRGGALLRTAAGIGAITTVLAVLVPTAIPTVRLSLVDFGNGPGTGGGDIEVVNPIVDLRRDLVRGADIPLVTIRTDDPDPSYLRIAVLSRFSDGQWSSGDRQIPSDQTADGTPLPALQGVDASVPRRSYHYDIDIADQFGSTWLPTEAPIDAITADGDWRFDTSTMDFIAADDDTDAAGASYSLEAVKLGLTARDLEAAPRGQSEVDSGFTELPPALPERVRELARQVTRGNDSDFAKAVALQDWFREDGGFTYSLDVSAGNGVDDLVRFLDPANGGRTGYCEQFAAAMAVMARELGIPARVAVGFLTPDREAGDTFVYSAHDMHAWPELYFPGSGWVRFEPTPADRTGQEPSYTLDTQPVVTNPSVSSSPTQSESAGSGPSASSSARIKETQEKSNDTADPAASQSGGVPWLPIVVALLLVLVAALLLTPSLVRGRRRTRRDAGGPEDLWDELRDTALDLRLGWPRQRSPRETGAVLATWFGSTGTPGDPVLRPSHGADRASAATAALDRIVAVLERTRYAADPATDTPEDFRADIETCRDALLAGVTASTRRRARWLPASVLSRPRRRSRSALSLVRSAPNGVVDHVG